MSLAPLTIELFERRFFQEACPYWTAYNATKKTEKVGQFRNDDPELSEEDMLSYSWLQFMELVENFPWGHVKVVCRSSQTSNSDKSPTLYVKWGTPETSNSYTSRRADSGYGASAGPWQFLIQQQQQWMESLQEARLEALRLNFENQQLAAALESGEDSTFKEKLILEGIGAVKHILTPTIISQQPPAALGTLGQKDEKAKMQEKGRPVSVDQIISDVHIIKQSVPGIHVNDVIRAVALFCKKSPDQAESYLKMLIQQVNESAG